MAPFNVTITNETVALFHCAGRCQTAWKLGFGAVLFLEALAFSVGILKMSRCVWFEEVRFRKVQRFANMCSAGVLLAVGLLHILPTASTLLDAAEHKRRAVSSHEFPAANVALLGLYMVILLCERVLRLPDAAAIEQKTTQQWPERSIGTAHYVDEEYLCDTSEDVSVRPTVRCGFRTPEFRAAAMHTACAAGRAMVEGLALGASHHIVCVGAVFIASASRVGTVAARLTYENDQVPLTRAGTAALATAFALALPVGMGLGIGFHAANAALRGVVLAVAAAKFIYFGAFEAPADELVLHRRWPLSKYCAMLCGAAFVVIITSALAGAHAL